MKIAIFEDNQTYSNNLINKIEGLLIGMDKDTDIFLCTDNPRKIMDFASKSTENMLFFLDICIGIEDNPLGLELADKIKKQNNNHKIVFITNYPETLQFDIQAKINALAYIAKYSPNFDCELLSVIYTALEHHKKESITVKCDYSRFIHSIPFADIYTIEAVKGSTRTKIGISHTNGYVEAYQTLKATALNLDGRFYRCNRSCYVNMDKIILFNTEYRQVTTRDNRTHDIAFAKIGVFKSVYTRYIL